MTEQENRHLIRELLTLPDWALKEIGRPGMTGEGRKVAARYVNKGIVQVYSCGEWAEIFSPLFSEDPANYRIKQPTRVINGFEVPDCLREAPPYLASYFCESLTNPSFCIHATWYGDKSDFQYLRRGIAHATAENAIMNTKARLGIDPYEEGE